MKSPIYCDNRCIIYPQVRDFLAESLAEQLKNYMEEMWPSPVWQQEQLELECWYFKAGPSFIYVRPEPKKHGRQNQIEGQPAGVPIVVIEDLISTGKSSLNAVDAIQAQGFEVLGMLALFSYGFAVAEDNFSAKSDCILWATMSTCFPLPMKVKQFLMRN